MKRIDKQISDDDDDDGQDQNNEEKQDLQKFCNEASAIMRAVCEVSFLPQF